MNDAVRQLTFAPVGHILTHCNVWSPDGRWIVYDTRSDAAGSLFDSARIERVEVATSRVEVLYESTRDARCGVASFSPVDDRVAFILGPEDPTPDWSYAANHRRGVIVDADRPGCLIDLDARDLTPPFTAGALRGGTHLHTFDPAGQWVAFTYEDAVIESPRRGVGVSVPAPPVVVPKSSPRNRNGSHFSVLVTTLHAAPETGSDQVSRASEEGWVFGRTRAIAFQGRVVTADGRSISEVFVVDLPADLTVAGDGPLQGTPADWPDPPRGCVQRRVTFTADRKYPGLARPRHWIESAPDGSRLAFLIKDDAGVVQFFTAPAAGGPTTQLTRNRFNVASAFTWSRDGRYLAHVGDNRICLTDSATGITRFLTPRYPDETAPRPEACVFSPDGRRVSFVRPASSPAGRFNQIFVVEIDAAV